MPGSQGYRDGLINARARAPYIDPGYRRQLSEGARLEMDADELQSELASLQEKFPNASFTLGADGRPTVRVTAGSNRRTHIGSPDMRAFFVSPDRSSSRSSARRLRLASKGFGNPVAPLQLRIPTRELQGRSTATG
jgi:hypothetical protein